MFYFGVGGGRKKGEMLVGGWVRKLEGEGRMRCQIPFSGESPGDIVCIFLAISHFSFFTFTLLSFEKFSLYLHRLPHEHTRNFECYRHFLGA